MISKREILLLIVGTLMVTSSHAACTNAKAMNRAQATSRMQSLKKNALAQTTAQGIVSTLFSSINLDLPSY
jgi:hypothetical protein